MADFQLSSALVGFLREAAAAPHQFGEWDCCMALANWVRTLTGVDPAAELRGRYRTALGWKRIVTRAGGMVPLVSHLATRAGLVPVAVVIAGDVGVVTQPIGPVGAICAGQRWVAKLSGGLSAGPALALGAWGIR